MKGAKTMCIPGTQTQAKHQSSVAADMRLHVGDRIDCGTLSEMENAHNFLLTKGIDTEVHTEDFNYYLIVTKVAIEPIEKPKTIHSLLDGIVAQICDKYCRYPIEEGHGPEWLTDSEDSPCNSCPLTTLL